MSQISFERFRERVLREPALQARLREAPDFAAFLPLVLELGRERGFEFTALDVTAAWQGAQRAWIERWL